MPRRYHITPRLLYRWVRSAWNQALIEIETLNPRIEYHTYQIRLKDIMLTASIAVMVCKILSYL